jgi:alkylhydroperoxidase family enzyme
MGHVDFMATVSGLPSGHVFDLEKPGTLDARRRLAMTFARKLTKEPAQIRQADIDALKAELTEKEIVQLVFAICHFNTMNRLADAFGVPLEKTNVFAQKPKAGAPEGGNTPPKQPPVPQVNP